MKAEQIPNIKQGSDDSCWADWRLNLLIWTFSPVLAGSLCQIDIVKIARVTDGNSLHCFHLDQRDQDHLLAPIQPAGQRSHWPSPAFFEFHTATVRPQSRLHLRSDRQSHLPAQAGGEDQSGVHPPWREALQQPGGHQHQSESPAILDQLRAASRNNTQLQSAHVFGSDRCFDQSSVFLIDPGPTGKRAQAVAGRRERPRRCVQRVWSLWESSSGRVDHRHFFRRESAAPL